MKQQVGPSTASARTKTRNAGNFPLENVTIYSSDLSHFILFGIIRRKAALLNLSSFSFLLSYAEEREPRLLTHGKIL